MVPTISFLLDHFCQHLIDVPEIRKPTYDLISYISFHHDAILYEEDLFWHYLYMNNQTNTRKIIVLHRSEVYRKPF
jgi:hypothetical protein